jgi:hypothetical protein
MWATEGTCQEQVLGVGKDVSLWRGVKDFRVASGQGSGTTLQGQ